VGLSRWDTVAESDQAQVLVETWVPACAGMARKGNSRIVTMFVEANWIAASFAGEAFLPYRIPGPSCFLLAERSNLGPLSIRWVEIASSRKALLAMTVSQFGRNLL
jgi:hypothetical protein